MVYDLIQTKGLSNKNNVLLQVVLICHQYPLKDHQKYTRKKAEAAITYTTLKTTPLSRKNFL
jgi:hypothetical protein